MKTEMVYLDGVCYPVEREDDAARKTAPPDAPTLEERMENVEAALAKLIKGAGGVK